MSSLFSILVLYGLLTMVVILVQVLMAVPQVGLPYLATPRDEPRDLTGPAGRSLRCLNNSVVAMALFAPAVLMAQAQGVAEGAMLTAAQVFLIARAVYVVLYIAGIAWVRTLVWTVAFLSNAWMYLMLL